MIDNDVDYREPWGYSEADPWAADDRWKYQKNVYYYVVRRHSGATSSKHLIKIMSRRFERWGDADDWRRFVQGEDTKIRRYSIIAIPKSDEIIC